MTPPSVGLVVLAVAISTASWLTAFRLRQELMGAQWMARCIRAICAGVVAGAGAWAAQCLAIFAANPFPTLLIHPPIAVAAGGVAILCDCAAFLLAEWRREKPAYALVSFGLGLVLGPGLGLASLGAGVAGGMGPSVVGSLAALAMIAVAGLSLGLIGAPHRRKTASLCLAGAYAGFAYLLAHEFRPPYAPSVLGSDPLGNLELSVAAGAIAALLLMSAGALLVLHRAGEAGALRTFQRALDALAPGVAFFDVRGRLSGFNESYRALIEPLGVTVQVGVARTDILKAARTAGWFSRIHRERAKTRPEAASPEGRLELSLADGRTLLADTFEMAGGGRAVILNDVTAAKTQLADLMTAREAAERASLAKADFLRNMSHELRTPLNIMLSSASVLERSRPRPDQRKATDAMRHAGRDLANLVDDLLFLARGPEAAAPTYAMPTDLNAVLHLTCAHWRRKAEEKALSFVEDVDPSLRWITCDGALISRALDRLLGNAVKFTDQGEVRLTVRRRGDMVDFEVSDTGPGLAAPDFKRVSEAFGRDGPEAARGHGGAGVGLSLCKSELRSLGGELVCAPGSEGGTRIGFSLFLPALPAHDAGIDGNAGERVLVVDDNAANRQLLSLLLEAGGYSCALAEDGRQAVDRARRENYAVILMDLQMPVLGGADAIREIRDLEARSGRPRSRILSVSADGRGRSTEDARRAGADGHIAKPVMAAELFAVLATQADGDIPRSKRPALVAVG